jgi:hypothetical protein
LDKCDNTKFKEVQLQEKGAPLTVWDLHHNDVMLMSNLGMTPKAVFHSLVQLEAYDATNSRKGKKYLIKIKS